MWTDSDTGSNRFGLTGEFNLQVFASHLALNIDFEQTH